MRNYLIILLLAAGQPTFAGRVASGIPVHDTVLLPSNEAFVSAVLPQIMGRSFYKYYLFAVADTCLFTKFNYDEWVKYHLDEPLSIVVMNELARKAYEERGTYYWRQDQLKGGVCIGQQKLDSVLHPVNMIARDSSLTRRQWRKALHKMKFTHLPMEERYIFFFSRPAFTDDGQYAVIDCNTVCGPNCGADLTFLFRRAGDGWRQIGRRINRSLNNMEAPAAYRE